MKRLILLLISFSAFNVNANDDVLKLLHRDLGKTIEIHSENEIWYCPDNTCEMYRALSPNKDFISFVYLYLFHKSDYIYLNEKIGNDTPFRTTAVEEPNVRSKVSYYCNETEATPSCILKNMQHKLKISVGFGRYDEGYFCYGFQENENICKKL